MSHVVLMIESRHVSEPLGIPRAGGALSAMTYNWFLESWLNPWMLLGHNPPSHLRASPIELFRLLGTGVNSYEGEIVSQ